MNSKSKYPQPVELCSRDEVRTIELTIDAALKEGDVAWVIDNTYGEFSIGLVKVDCLSSRGVHVAGDYRIFQAAFASLDEAVAYTSKKKALSMIERINCRKTEIANLEKVLLSEQSFLKDLCAISDEVALIVAQHDRNHSS